MSIDSKELWVFGYGSIIWRPGFKHLGRQKATLSGYERRFWQASHDHRGTPETPGRVVTLVPVPGSVCRGMAYRLPVEETTQILQQLDEREQDGYERMYSRIVLADGTVADGLTWIASEGNPSWRGEMPAALLAELIATTHGPSGSNRDYLLNLHEALLALDIDDAHIAALVSRVVML